MMSPGNRHQHKGIFIYNTTETNTLFGQEREIIENCTDILVWFFFFVLLMPMCDMHQWIKLLILANAICI
jgi:hypothetical protein